MHLWPVLMVALAFVGCSRQPQLDQFEGFAQGTSYHISWWSASPVDGAALDRDLTREFARIDGQISNYREDSAIARFNANLTSVKQPVGAEIVSLVEQARVVSRASGGCYDLTIKPLFDLWGFMGDKLIPPDEAALRHALAIVGMERLETLDGTHLRKGLPILRVDLSSIGQGYSVGRIAHLLEQRGITNYLAEIGGELQTRGHKPGGVPWRVAVEKPLPGEQRVEKIITIARDEPLAVMTSGTYRHYFDFQGRRYSHILDARTGKPVEHKTLLVTVLHPDPTQADAWSTALLCLGREAGLPVADRFGIAAIFIEEGQGGLTEFSSQPLARLDGIKIDLIQ
ncbi:MAG: FAD:protein FMN transferase [Gammaproteobacteria bacterium]|nr:FAD:protein FMN transferase [Gammaproteobacteria bacterium]MBU1653339.1 FAD:protein FMN transferase [Gammaproteobacteria bacterium]MBU1962767.1 FAD:protein FMN transferase [Gammaproteobacteria bacterium]